MVMLSWMVALVTAAAVVVTTPTPVAAQSCAALGPAGAFVRALADGGDADGGGAEGGDAPGPAAAEDLCRVLVDLERRAAAAEAQAAELRSALTLARSALPPPGAVLLVDDGRGCPQGWTDVALAEPEVFAGRVPVAAGFAETRAFRGFRQIGGVEEVTLDAAALPPHAHGLPLAFRARNAGGGGRGGGDGFGGGSFGGGGGFGDQVPVRALAGREQTERAGVGAPHQNMPPFVALFWCRRD